MSIRLSLLVPSIALFSLLPQITAAQDSPKQNPSPTPTVAIDYGGFLNLSTELQAYREERLIDISAFAAMLQEDGVLLLDTRSAAAFHDVHIEGALHINFSDFTAEKLAAAIPDKNTTILIYCNNNFTDAGPSLASKAAPLALNIPTFINLYGYGYHNIYELRGVYTPEQAEKHLVFERNPNAGLRPIPVFPKE